jgi:predicted HNH restriction endonuclease
MELVKECCTCKISKPLEDFPINNSKKNGRSYKCKECTSKYNKLHYKNNSESYKKRSHINKTKERDKIKKIKEGLRCSVCGEDRWWTLDFHHLDNSKKEFNISDGLGIASLKKVKKELEKCIVLCSNCHRDLHYKLRENIQQH